MKTTETAAIVRFGNTWFVLAFDEHFTEQQVTKDTAEAHAVARFPFEGKATRSNPSCVMALAHAKSEMRKAVR